MTETLVAAPRTPYALLLDIAARLGPAAQRAQERAAAVTVADSHVYGYYPNTLGSALEACDWTGRHALVQQDIAPSAVAFLGNGIWLHHTSTDPEQHVLTLLIPCACGRGYTGCELADEHDLLLILDALSTSGGLMPHQSDAGGNDCDNTPATPTRRSWSADT
ncbi:hypothetical protein [Streptomyces sp. NPDC008125]|uniref:hypothetical protein n=1 Tax=Streptomyces sp. NPDC008125 TaxID=3364811 RepID=UPI0036E169FC